MDNNITIVLKIDKKEKSVDVEIPTDITAMELVVALNKAYELGIDIMDVNKCFLKSENPIALIKGNRLVSEFGLRNGSIINYTE